MFNSLCPVYLTMFCRASYCEELSTDTDTDTKAILLGEIYIYIYIYMYV